MKHKLIFFISLISLSSAFAGKPVIDSLQALLETDLSPTQRLHVQNKIAFNYYRIDPAITVAMSLENIKYAKEIGDEEGRLSAINNMAIGQVFQDESQKALETFQLLEEEGKKSGFMTIVHRACNNKGNLFSDLGQEEKAISAFHQAVAFAKLEKDDEAYCIYLNNLVGMLIRQEEFEKAMRYYENALPVAKKLANQSILGEMTHGVGHLLEKMNKPKEAHKYYLEALEICKRTEDKQSIISILNSLAGFEQAQGNLNKSLSYNKQALQIAKDFGSSRILTNPCLAMATTHMARKEFEESIKYSNMGLEAASQSQNIAIEVKFYELLSQAYEGQSDFESALTYQKKFKAVQDSLAEINQSQKIKEVSLKYDLEAKDEENEILRAQQVQQALEIENRNLLATMGGIAFGLVSIITLLLYRNNKRKFKYNRALEKEVKLATQDLENSNIELQKSNKELERFAHIASHDLKEPLRNITSFVRLIERRLEGKDEHLKEYLQFVQNNAKQMHILIEDVLEFSKLSEAQPAFEQVDVQQTLKQVSMSMEQFLIDKNATLEIDQMPELTSSGSQLYLLFKNIIENGIIFNDQEEPLVQVSYRKAGYFHLFQFTDNGIGIEEKYQDKIFGMFNRLHARVKHQGSGLGLSICKKIIDRLNGEIWVESEKSEGSTFFIKLPMEPQLSKGKLNLSFATTTTAQELIPEQV